MRKQKLTRIFVRGSDHKVSRVSTANDARFPFGEMNAAESNRTLNDQVEDQDCNKA